MKRYVTILLLVCLLFCGCGKQSTTATKSAEKSSRQKQTEEFFAMDTYMTVTAYGAYAKEAVKAAKKRIEKLEQELSVGVSTSDIARINANGGGTAGTDAAALIDQSLTLYADTDGAFDISIFPLMESWGFTTQKYRVPKKTEIAKLLKKVDAGKIRLDSHTGQVQFEEPGMKIDLGGIAKGYASACVMDIFKKHKVTSGIVSLGGNVQALGKKTDGSLWRVAVEDPENKENYIGVLSIADKAVITSGGYERYFEKNGVTYHHILDPATGYPARSGLTSVTIVSKDGTLADGLSTSLFIMGRKKAETYWRKHADSFDMILVDDKGKIWVTKGLESAFESQKKWQIIQ